MYVNILVNLRTSACFLKCDHTHTHSEGQHSRMIMSTEFESRLSGLNLASTPC